jgi:hypothetical protein
MIYIFWGSRYKQPGKKIIVVVSRVAFLVTKKIFFGCRAERFPKKDKYLLLRSSFPLLPFFQFVSDTVYSALPCHL